MLTRGESTNPGAFMQALIEHGLVFELHGKPGGVNLFIHDQDGNSVAHVSGQRLVDILEAVPAVNAIGSKRVPAPTAAVRDFAAALVEFGFGNKKFIALDPTGLVVLYGPERQPGVFRQRAAAERNGRAVGAVAIWDCSKDTVTWIPPG